MKSVYLTVTVGPDFRLLPKFLEYYIKQGIKKFLIILNSDNPKISNILSMHGLTAVHSWLGSFSEKDKQENERRVIDDICSEDDWIVYADLDEFQHYPLGLLKSIYLADKNHDDYIEGRLIDRVSESGKLIELNNRISLEEQFPLGGYITSPLLKAWDKKIVAARKNKIVGGGHHIFLNSANLRTLPYNTKISGPFKDVKIHHFKWDSQIINRFKGYLDLKDESLFYWKKEISLFLNYYKKNFKIKTKTKKFEFSKIDNILNI